MIKMLLKQRPDNSALTKKILLTTKLTGLLVMIMCMQVSATSFAQQKISITANQASIKNLLSVSGKVTDQNGLPLPGVSVKVSGSSLGTTTDSNGAYSFRIPDNSISLEFTYIGYLKKVIPLNGSVLNVVLTVDNQDLKEVVVTGYTAYKKSQSASSSTLVSADKINDVPGLTFDQILQGRVPGMSVISSSGQPGASASTVIRGIGSVNGSSTPLYILDGTPIEGSFFQTINPADIEDVRVLKDASAKALYGSRGSNGVIIITSKKGKAGKVQVQYTSQYGFSDLTRSKTTMMNTAQRLAFEEGVGADFGRTLGPGWTYSSKNPDYINGTATFRQQADHIIDSLRNINIDWRDQIYQNSKFQEQQASVSGGNENIRFYNSLSYYKQDGIAKRTGLERYSLKSNVDFKDNKFSGNVNIAIGYSNSSFTEGEGSTGSGTAMSAAYYALPYENPYAPDGTLIHPGNKDNYFILDQREGSQALERLQNSSNKTDQLKSIIGITLAYQVMPALKITTRAGVDYRNSTDQLFINPDSYYGSTDDTYTLGGKGRFEEGTGRNFNFISTTGLTYAKTFGEKHDFEASAYYEYVYNNYNAFNFTGFGLDSRLPETPAGATNSADFLPEVGGGKTKSGLASFMGVARYTYDSKYTLTGSYRYDGSTKVAPKNKWHGFYSAGANWNVKKESFLQNLDLISEFNLRSSYGTTASPLDGDFNYLATYAIGTDYVNGVGTGYAGERGLRPNSPGNINYDWEYVNEFNAGFDLSLFKSRRLRLTMDFYNKRTSNMFFDQPLSALSGYQSVPLSTGKMQNRGLEFDLSGDIIRTSSFTWSLGANAGYNKNKILYLTDAADQLLDGDTRIFKVGLPYGSYYAPGWAGVNTQTGAAQYYNPDGSITNVYNSTTQSVANSGSMFPKLTGGFNTALSYKGFSATALFSFVSGIKRWNNEDFYNENQRYATSNQSLRMLEDRWMKAGDEKTLQRFDVPRNFTSKDIEDASFLRLRNLNIGYTVPQKVLDKTGVIKTLKFFVQGQNLFTWTKWRGMDPENNSVYGRFQYPNARTYTAGLSANF